MSKTKETYGIRRISRYGSIAYEFVCSWECAKAFAKEHRVGITRFETGYDLTHTVICPMCEERIEAIDNEGAKWVHHDEAFGYREVAVKPVNPALLGSYREAIYDWNFD